MDGEKVQPTRISEEEYTRFKQYVQDVHGTTRGHLSTEIENALREYRQPDDADEPLARIEQDIATIKARLADAEADGGVDAAAPAPSPDDAHTHTRDNTTKPNRAASRSEKVEYLIDEKYDREPGGSVKVETILDDVREVYSFGDRTAEDYVQLVIDALNAKRHPKNPSVILWGEEIDRIRENLADEE
jgi:hypothetical protein